mmetsp:Transcript_2277/g.7618  ORF Transcript_2277/g.7618 Transcript_2277/m.7618 type:complete len:440 (+) Transcript_2277:997-2316(+)
MRPVPELPGHVGEVGDRVSPRVSRRRSRFVVLRAPLPRELVDARVLPGEGPRQAGWHGRWNTTPRPRRRDDGDRRQRRQGGGRTRRPRPRRRRTSAKAAPRLPAIRPDEAENYHCGLADRVLDGNGPSASAIPAGVSEGDPHLRHPRHLLPGRRELQVLIRLELLRKDALRHAGPGGGRGGRRGRILARPARTRQTRDRRRSTASLDEHQVRDAPVSVRDPPEHLDVRHHLLQLRSLRSRQQEGPQGHRRGALDQVHEQAVSPMGGLRRRHDRHLARRRDPRDRRPAVEQSRQAQSDGAGAGRQRHGAQRRRRRRRIPARAAAPRERDGRTREIESPRERRLDRRPRVPLRRLRTAMLHVSHLRGRAPPLPLIRARRLLSRQPATSRRRPPRSYALLRRLRVLRGLHRGRRRRRGHRRLRPARPHILRCARRVRVRHFG